VTITIDVSHDEGSSTGRPIPYSALPSGDLLLRLLPFAGSVTRFIDNLVYNHFCVILGLSHLVVRYLLHTDVQYAGTIHTNTLPRLAAMLIDRNFPGQLRHAMLHCWIRETVEFRQLSQEEYATLYASSISLWRND
jgi:hypothetical protein